ncbi:MAG: hypothetical protein LW698_04125 [Planctomycetaceae bacterium]|nr:hypothetical protein [Planctomycetaceae bacterium]
MCRVFFALLPRRGASLPNQLPLVVAVLLLAAVAPAVPSLADELTTNAAAIVPADAAFLSATLRAREQYDRFMKSNAFRALKDLPAVRRALGSLEEQRSMPGSPFSMAETFMQLPENEQAVDVLADMVATDTFVYGEPSCISFLRLLQKVQELQGTAPLQAELGRNDGLEGVQKAAIVKGLAANLDLLVVPDIVWGFRTTKVDAAKAQLRRIEVLLKLVTQANPAMADALARKPIAGGEVVTFTIQGDQLPWGELEDELAAGLDDKADLDKVLDRLRKLDVVVALGVIGDRVILSVGDSIDHLQKLALPGTGRQGLLDTPPFAQLRAHKDKPLTGLAYVSDALADLNRESASSGFRMLNQAADAAIQQAALPAEAAADTRRLLSKAEKDLGRRLPKPGPWLAFSFLTDQGYEGYAWDWARNQPFDGSRRLDLLEHVGGAPLAAVVSRIKSDPALLDDLTALASGSWGLFMKYGVPRADETERERVEAFDEHVVPLGKKLMEVLRAKIVPALADGQVGLVIDAKTKATRVQRDLPASAEPLPLLEPAIVLPLADPKLFREGLSDLFALTDELVAAARTMAPDAVPAGYEVPAPEKAKVAAGSIWSFALPASGLDTQLRPAIGVGDQAAVFSLVPAQAGRLLAAARMETGSQLATFEEPLAGAAAIDFAGLVDVLRPWVVYLTRYGCVQQRDGRVDADEELAAEDETAEAKEALAHVAVALEVAKCFRAATAETSITEEATVTHWRNVIRDLPAKP